ncbi:hypothetical protein SteCoe_39353 [Stentor coeruleus]|uniref:Protein kinase domain-containing protein n=1 Tax=Stentor coeruleus TaxID=5963 RepID=A0A1R2AKS3_9CILI|nr:hypothetical protein SteCoe_39353 [Stentor coeruleus]
MEKVDIFTLGMTLLQMSTYENLDLGFNKKENNHKLLSLIENVTYIWAKPLLYRMLQVNPEYRPTFKELLKEIKTIETLSFTISNQ